MNAAMQLVWVTPTIQEWQNFLNKSDFSNWMQSASYARATYARDFKSPRCALLQKDGRALGFVVMQEIKLGPIHLMEIQRGPIWFEEEHRLEHFLEFAKLLRNTFPTGMMRRFRWLPEWSFQEDITTELTELGYKQQPQTFESVRLDLTLSLENLRQRMTSKWRNCLNKSEKQRLQIRVDARGNTLHEFLMRFQNYKKEKKFLGPSPEFMRQEFRAALKERNAFLLTAQVLQEDVAGVMILIHGKSASYRIGWNSEVGKKTNAHYLLLWTAAKLLKNQGLTYFDLGGIKTDESPGVSHFKLGIGGERFKLLSMMSW